MAEDEEKPAVRPSEEKIPRGHETILLVEDEPMILEMAAKMLGHQGYTILSAGKPEEAIRIAAEYAGHIDLLITDVVLPEMNGRDLAGKLTLLYPDLKLLFMSGYTANAISHQGVLEDGVQFLQKPFSMKNLAAKVREVLDNTKAPNPQE
jgi:DNA-binding response OmpR family regulator